MVSSLTEQNIPVTSIDYPSEVVDIEVDAEGNHLVLDTASEYNAYWAQALYLNRSPYVVSFLTDKSTNPFYIPPQSQLNRQGWGRKITLDALPAEGLPPPAFGAFSDFTVRIADIQAVRRV